MHQTHKSYEVERQSHHLWIIALRWTNGDSDYGEMPKQEQYKISCPLKP